MARISGKIAQLGWFSGSSLSLRGKSLVPSLTNVKFKYPIVILPRTQVLLRYCRAMSDMNSTTSAVQGAAAGSAPPVMVREKISLTEKEREIFDRLLQVLRHFNLQTQLRVAGGWVRDKLLGKECYDIDIALDDMLGREFCEKVNDYLVSTGAESQGIGVIQSNPDQSKHLETARMRLFDVWIDFVNLRSEDYAENSRIPTMRFGTAEQDAYRRDLTINSLFYNINTSMVEDFTGRGMDDLRWGKIVTPLPPKETFLDDPLRVLRAIRFGARFEFEIDKAVKIAASDDDVRAAIADKISRERIGHEIDLMVSGNQPVKAMTYVCELSLFSVVFTLPPKFEPSISENQNRLCVHFIDAAWKLVRAIGSCTLNEEQRRLYLYAAMFLPYRKTIYKDTKGKTVPVVSHMFRDSLKLKAGDAETVVKLHNAVEKFLSLIPLLTSDKNQQVIEQVDYKGVLNSVPESLKLRILVGLLLREIKDFWRAALLLSTLLHPTSIEQVVELEARGELFKKAEKAIIELGLDRVWEVKPLINGKDIMRILGLKTGGPVVSEWQRKLVQWQLAYPSGTADECIDWMVRESQLKRVKT